MLEGDLPWTLRLDMRQFKSDLENSDDSASAEEEDAFSCEWEARNIF